MTTISQALAVTLLSGAFFVTAQAANAQGSSSAGSPPPTTATRPSAPDQTSLPSNVPPASTTQTTGQASQEPAVKDMNQKEKDKVERTGK